MFSVLKGVISAIKNAEAYDQSQFYKCQWQKSPDLIWGYILYRWIIAVIFSVVLLAAILDMCKTTLVEFSKFFIYLTHWGFILCTVQALMGAILVTRKYNKLQMAKTDSEKKQMLLAPSNLADVYWIVYTMSVVSAFGITIIFWTKVYIPTYHEWGVMIFLLHGLNTLLMFLDVIVVAHPLRFMHFLWTFGFVLTYLFFSYAYYLAGGTNIKNHPFIYHSLNWENPENALRFCISSMIYGFIIHVIMWIFSCLVRKISGASTLNQQIQTELNCPTLSSHNSQNCVSVVTVGNS